MGVSVMCYNQGANIWQALFLSDALLLPSGFGTIYLGETFVGFVSLSNSSRTAVNRVVVKVELQAGAQSRPLMNTDANAPIASFSGAENLDWIVSHELKEPGVHYMICTASYLDGNGEEKRVRQCFKFNEP